MGSKYDFYSPFFRAAIISDPRNREGSRWPLWTFGSPENSKRLSQDPSVNGLNALAYCTEVSVKLNLGYIPELTATLEPPFQDARKFIDSPLVEWTQSLLEVMIGYTNGPDYAVLSPIFEGNIQQPEVSIGTDASITLKAIGHGQSLAIKEEISRTFSKTSRLDMISEALKPFGLTVDSSMVSGAELTALNTKETSTFTSNQSAWFFALQLAKTCRCWLYTENTTVKLIPWDAAYGASPKFKFTLFDHPNNGVIRPSTGDFPILSFSTSTPAVYLAGATKALRLHGYDSKTREVKTQTVTDATEAPKRSGDGPVDVSKAPSEGDLFPENTADPAQLERAKAAFRTAQTGMGVRVEVETLGIPDLFPGALVAITGVSKNRLDGNYLVFDVTHTVSSGGFTTRFTGITNIAQLAGQLGFGTPAANPNTQTKQTTPAQASTTNNNTIEVPVKPATPISIDADGIKGRIDFANFLRGK